MRVTSLEDQIIKNMSDIPFMAVVAVHCHMIDTVSVHETSKYEITLRSYASTWGSSAPRLGKEDGESHRS
jgi:hypothetical protein